MSLDGMAPIFLILYLFVQNQSNQNQQKWKFGRAKKCLFIAQHNSFKVRGYTSF